MVIKFVYYVRFAVSYWMIPLFGIAGAVISGQIFKAEIFIVITSTMTGIVLGYILTEAMRMRISREH